MASQRKPEDRLRICPSSAHRTRKGISRTSVIYWREKVERTVGGTGKTNPHYCARISYKGRRIRFALETANKNKAASKAAAIFSFLTENGWAATLRKYKPDAVPVEIQDGGGTVGALISAAAKYSTARERTFTAYTQALRKIAAEITGICGGRKHQTRKIRGNEKWKTEVDAVLLVEITPAKVQEWRQARLKEAGRDASAKRKTAVTVNSTIRNAKALFSEKIRRFVAEEVVLPDPLPFEGVKSEKVGSLRYQSKIDAPKLLKAAKKDLTADHPECYKFFLLALVCGLRVSEIDHLLWEAFDFERSVLHIEHTAFHELKSEDSAGDIDLTDETVEFFRGQAERVQSDFVIEVDEEVAAPPSRAYRCQEHIDYLKTWLRKNGVDAQKPIHTLRKEVGALIASEQGIYAASRYLRHSDIQVTAAYYADKKRQITPDLVIGDGA